ncbi:hypothetical protein HA397_27695, partial [Escherichia coli]|nr:hypothetical protein [Escherichia coli]
MFEAIGEPLPTTGLPLAFAQADLRSTSGWKARVEAAERLARSGAISPNRLLGIYTERRPAASGGIWDRVAAIQALDVAVLSGDDDKIATALPPAWGAMQRSELEVPFAEVYGERLAALGLPGEAGRIALRLGLLSDSYETVARTAGDGAPAIMVAVATGGTVPGNGRSQLELAIATAFDAPRITPAMQARLNEGRSGEALLEALRLITDGA